MLVTLKDVWKSLKANMCDRRFQRTDLASILGVLSAAEKAECSVI